MEDRLLVSLFAYCECHGGMRFVDKVARDLRGIGGNAAVSEEAIIGDLDRRRAANHSVWLHRMINTSWNDLC
jgi:hypothetical protein